MVPLGAVERRRYDFIRDGEVDIGCGRIDHGGRLYCIDIAQQGVINSNIIDASGAAMYTEIDENGCVSGDGSGSPAEAGAGMPGASGPLVRVMDAVCINLVTAETKRVGNILTLDITYFSHHT